MRSLKFIKLFVLCFTLTAVQGQEIYQNLYFKAKSTGKAERKNDYMPDKQGFYIYRNCIYNFTLKNKLQLSAKVIDIRNDSIYYIDRSKLDTNSIHPSHIKKIRMIGDRIMGLFSGYKLSDHEYVFEQTAEPKKFKYITKTVYSADSSMSTNYELVPYLTAQGIDMVYERNGVNYYFEGVIPQPVKEDSIKKDTQIRKIAWFTPSNANEIRGVNIGIQTMQAEGEPLHIKGMNLNADLLSLMLGCMSLFSIPFNNALINMPDTVTKEKPEVKISGVSLSFGGVVGNTKLNGLSINVGICFATQTNGLVITGSQNLIEEFRGVNISLLRNRSIKGRGIQIGLLNICKHLKGIQIGLWNVNNKRKLPFINWSFKD